MLFVGIFVDWIFQSDWQAKNKSKWSKGDNKLDSLDALFTHSVIYGFLTMFITALIITQCNYEVMPKFIYIVGGGLIISHMFIDSRIPVKWIMRLKGMNKEQINDYQNYGFMHIGIDHRLHELVILILAFFV